MSGFVVPPLTLMLNALEAPPPPRSKLQGCSMNEFLRSFFFVKKIGVRPLLLFRRPRDDGSMSPPSSLPSLELGPLFMLALRRPRAPLPPLVKLALRRPRPFFAFFASAAAASSPPFVPFAPFATLSAGGPSAKLRRCDSSPTRATGTCSRRGVTCRIRT